MQYVLTKKSIQSVRDLINLLKQDGYNIYNNLDHVQDNEAIIGICIDLDKKEVFKVSVSSMIAWCQGEHRPLNAEEIVNNYQRLITNKDYKYYNHLISIKSKEVDRACGFFIKGK